MEPRPGDAAAEPGEQRSVAGAPAAPDASVALRAPQAIDVPTVPAAVRATPPSVGEAVSATFDLLVASSRQIRGASLYVGLVTLALLGPATLLALALIRTEGGLDEALLVFVRQRAFDPNYEPGLANVFGLTVFTAGLGGFALLFDLQIVTMAVLGGVAVGRRIGLRDGLRLARQAFWPVLAAAILVGIAREAIDRVISAVAAPTSQAALDAMVIAQLVGETIVLAPFAYYLAGIVIGGVGPLETLRRSVRIARTRWRLAFLVAATGTVVSIVQAFALGAGLDLAVRVASAVGLRLDGSAATAAVTSVVVLGGLVALGSLVATVTAMIVAPQVVVFLRMTGYSSGLARSWPAPAGLGPTDKTRLVTRPMVALIAVGGVAALLGLLEL